MYQAEKMFEFEDIYSHGKRLSFIKQSIGDYCQKQNKNKKQIKILDIGCGTGIGTTFPIACLSYPIIGVDIDRNSIDYARKMNIYSNASFECGLLEELTHLAGFDVIICSEVLEHVSGPKEFLLLLKNRLKPEGIIILTVPNGYGWFELEKFVYEKLGLKFLFNLLDQIIHVRRIFHSKKSLPMITLNNKDKHLQRFTYKRLKLLFEETGLNKIKESRAGIFGGQISEILLGWCKLLLKLNNWLGDKAPSSLVIDWYFVLEKLSNN